MRRQTLETRQVKSHASALRRERAGYNAEMNQAPPRCRWFQFSLRTLFIVVTLLAVWLGWNLYQVGERVEAVREIERNGGSVSPPDRLFRAQNGLPYVWRLCGTQSAGVIFLGQRHRSDDWGRISRLFPEAAVFPYADDIPDRPLSIPDATEWEEITQRRLRGQNGFPLQGEPEWGGMNGPDGILDCVVRNLNRALAFER